MRAAELQQVDKALREATTFQMIFGAPAGPQTPISIKRQIRFMYANLAGLVHPDKHPAEAAHASDLFQKLTRARAAADAAAMIGAYHESFAPGRFESEDTKPVAELRSARAIYQMVNTPFRSGDFSQLYRATSSVDGEVLLKVAASPPMASWLDREAGMLRRFQTDPRLIPMLTDLPELLDTFLIAGPGSTRYRVNAVRHQAGFVSATQILEAYPDGLDGPDAAWIGRRILTIPLAALNAGLAHGAITPDHVLVHPISHMPQHIGWAHAQEHEEGTRLRQIIERWRHLYPPEVFAKRRYGHRSDLYMAARVTMLLFRKGAIPRRVLAVLTRCTDSEMRRRYRDGWEALAEYTTAIRAEWGKEYRPLKMPTY